MSASGTVAGRLTQAERRHQMRRALMDATYVCIRDVGYRATTTRRVAERAGVSLGAIAHHFPNRIELITASLEDVAGRAFTELLAAVRAVEGSERARLVAVLELVWGFFTGDLFVVWVRSWLAAVEDAELHAALAPLEERFADVLVSVTDQVRPAGVPARVWSRRFGLALDAIRGAALTRALAPGRRWTADHWPATRDELVRFLDS